MGCLFSMMDSHIERRPQGLQPKRRFSWSGSNEHIPTPSGDFHWLPKEQRPRIYKKALAPTWWDTQCSICEEVFLDRKTRDRHMREVHQIKPKQKCPKCSQTFSRTSHLTRHLNTKHRDTPPTYDCDICEKSFLREGNMMRHKKLVHGQQKDFKCEECPAKYAHKQDLDKHLKKGKHYRTFRCTYCKQTLVFKSFEHQERHFLSLPGNGGVYSCRNKRAKKGKDSQRHK